MWVNLWQIYAAIELGGGVITATLENGYFADGVEHSVAMARQKHQLVITVDNTQGKVVSGSNKSKELNLGIKPELHIGGIPKDSKYYG